MENYKELKTNNCLTQNCRWYESQSKTRTVLTGYLKPKETEEKRSNSNDPPPRCYRYNRSHNTSINRWENVLTITTLKHVTSTLYSASSVRMRAENSSPSMCACTRECSSPVEIANNDMLMYDNESQMEKRRKFCSSHPVLPTTCPL